MNFPEPQLASPMPKGGINYAQWVAEEKYDGHRILVRVKRQFSEDLHASPQVLVSAVSRNNIAREIPPQVYTPLQSMPDGIYDGELTVPGSRSYGVTDLLNREKLSFVMFDILESNGMSTCHFDYSTRRMILAKAYEAIAGVCWSVKLAEVFPCISHDQLTQLTSEFWADGREGLILKKKSSIYIPGKRTKDWIKIKALRSDVLTITGYEGGKNGPFSKVRLADGSKHNDIVGSTTVKTRNMKELDRLAQDPQSFIGRKLRIEYQERTPDGSYRHPRWDRFEDE